MESGGVWCRPAVCSVKAVIEAPQLGASRLAGQRPLPANGQRHLGGSATAVAAGPAAPRDPPAWQLRPIGCLFSA